MAAWASVWMSHPVGRLVLGEAPPFTWDIGFWIGLSGSQGTLQGESRLLGHRLHGAWGSVGAVNWEEYKEGRDPGGEIISNQVLKISIKITFIQQRSE